MTATQNTVLRYTGIDKLSEILTGINNNMTFNTILNIDKLTFWSLLLLKVT